MSKILSIKKIIKFDRLLSYLLQTSLYLQFGNTFTSYSPLISVSIQNTTGFMDSFGKFLWTHIVCCICFECIQLPMDWILNVNQPFGRINAPKDRPKWTIDWRYCRWSCYILIGISLGYFMLFDPFTVLEVINCIIASIAEYFSTLYLTEYLSTSSEIMCYVVNLWSCILILIDLKLFGDSPLGFISKHCHIFILLFASCLSQFASTVVFPHNFWNRNEPHKAVRFVILNLLKVAVFILALVVVMQLVF